MVANMLGHVTVWDPAVCHHCIPEALVIRPSPLLQITFILYHQKYWKINILHVCCRYLQVWYCWNVKYETQHSDRSMSNTYKPSKCHAPGSFSFYSCVCFHSWIIEPEAHSFSVSIEIRFFKVHNVFCFSQKLIFLSVLKTVFAISFVIFFFFTEKWQYLFSGED